jgi:hypothetical protein
VVANVGNWLVTHAVADFIVMPWATVNLADLLIVVGATVIFAGWGGRVVRHLTSRTRPVMTGSSTNYDPHGPRTVRISGHLGPTRRSRSAIANDDHPRSRHLVSPRPPNTAATAPTAAATGRCCMPVPSTPVTDRLAGAPAKPTTIC